jgi:hypothetical protein
MKWKVLFMLRNYTVDLYLRENETGRFSYNTPEWRGNFDKQSRDRNQP